MGKLLILIMLVVVGAWLVRRALRGVQAPPADGNAERGAAREELVRCVHCGLLLPRSEARESAGAIYCSEEHARLGPRRGAR